MKTQKWTKEKINNLIKLYPKANRYKCAELIGFSVEEITYKIRKLGLKKEKSLNVDDVINIKTPYIAYILGFMWADGYISSDGRHFNVSGVEEDMKEIEWVFDTIGNWCKHLDNRERYGWKNAKTFIGSNKEIHEFLIEHNYDKKSFVSADKILAKIPDALKHYFFRGLIDGDGCFYYKDYARQFALTSTYEQDWVYFETLCQKLNIRYSIKKTKIINKKSGKENKNSVLRILGKPIIILGDFLYQGEQFGLLRKQEKYKTIKNSYVSNTSNRKILHR